MLNNLTPYYEENHLRANLSKTQVCAFHLRNHEVNRQLNITWPGTPLKNCPHPVYLGVTLDGSLSFKTHVENTKAKMTQVENTKAKICARTKIISKLTGTTWGASPSTLRCTELVRLTSDHSYVVIKFNCWLLLLRTCCCLHVGLMLVYIVIVCIVFLALRDFSGRCFISTVLLLLLLLL